MLDSILKTFIRNIVPGFVFVVFCFLVPASVLNIEIFDFVFRSDALILIGVVFGFILDGFGAYRYTPFFKSYGQAKTRLIERLKAIEKTALSSSDPDAHLADLWITQPDVYERLFEERAEWVSILNSSFCFMLAGALAIFIFVYYSIIGNYPQWLIALSYSFVCFFVSYKMADTGTRRMRAHDEKMVRSIAHTSEAINKNQDQTGGAKEAAVVNRGFHTEYYLGAGSDIKSSDD